ncbi:hypothetical protein B9Q02_11375 [Candidatus Marsarchaeota G1 archaeon BE_D]|jgi:3-isopropylmalate dehydratase large subunit|uniref:Aconitase/3-isopropylmalate dehydratase large subunit alpha/beta/alpha domain-containing protein n=2 Tax=Candidatus Marsarchaeota group 1 TaxID=2203770 RepID=A0A2R6A8L1_9ARCH|nr:MAG: hypothetical protein B9Q02_11375 [Candidatus Marsarchaeota G1 archaeon BE_D]
MAQSVAKSLQVKIKRLANEHTDFTWFNVKTKNLIKHSRYLCIGMNIIEKILKVHSVDEKNEVIPGDIVEVRVDKVIMLDMVSVHPEFMNNPPKRPFDVSKVAVIFDHYVPPPTIEIATNVEKNT